MTPQSVAPSPTRLPSGLRALWPWYLALILASYAVTLLTDGAYWYLRDFLKASPRQSLWLSAFWGLCYIPISLLAGRNADRFGARRMARFMGFASAATALLVWGVQLWPTVLVLAGLLVFYNVATSSVWPAMESAVTKIPGNLSLNNRLTLYNVCWSVTNCLALVTVGSWAALSWNMLFIVPAIVSLLAFLILLIAPKVPAHAPVQQSGPERRTDLTESRGHDPHKLLLMAWIGNTMCYVAINVLLPVLPDLTTAAGFVDIKQSTAAGAVWTFTRCAGFIVTWLWSTWHYKPGILILMQLLLALSFLGTMVFPIAPIPGMLKPGAFIFAQGIFGFCSAFIYASSLYYAMHVSSGAGGHAGIHEALIGLGVAIGPSIGALFGKGEGVAAIPGIAYSVTGILVCGIIAMMFAAKRSTRVLT